MKSGELKSKKIAGKYITTLALLKEYFEKE